MTLQDLKGFARFLCEADPRECPVGQKSHKSEQIEVSRIQNSMFDLERFELFLCEADSGSVLRTEISQI